MDTVQQKGPLDFIKGLIGGAMGSDATPETVAAVDLGSNSFHLVVAQFQHDALNIADRVSEMVRLGGGITADGTILPEVEERALACLERFRERLAGLGPEAVRVVGTNTLRQLGERSDFVIKAEAALGRPIEVISGIEEARLIYSGVAADLEVVEGRRLVMDIGGGSTELIVGQGQSPLYLESLSMGCVSVTRQHFADGKITLARLETARLTARRLLRPVAGSFKGLGWQQAIGASGTFKALDRIVRACEFSSEGITPKAMEQLAGRLAEIKHIDKIDLPGLSPERAPVIVGGWAVAKALMDGLGLERVIAAQGAMREGVMYDLLGRTHHADVRARTVAALAARYHADTAHGDMIGNTALTLLSGVAADWGLTGEAPQRFLSWAGALHEIGRDIAHSGYHKHGAYVLANADLPGFSRQEQMVLAALVKSHRRKFKASQMRAELPARWAEPTLKMAVLLRLAVILHRGRTLEATPDITLTATENRLALRFPKRWLADHALTQGDLESEAEALSPEFELSFR